VEAAGTTEARKLRGESGTSPSTRSGCCIPGGSKFKPIHVSNIPDDDQVMDDELVEPIKSATAPIIAEHFLF